MQRPPNVSFLSFIASGLLAIAAMAAPAMAMTTVPDLTADLAPMPGALYLDTSAGHLVAQPPGGATFEPMDIFFENTALLDVGADTELISAQAAAPIHQLTRSDGHVFDDWPTGIAQ